jgi:hypothetical protein
MADVAPETRQPPLEKRGSNGRLLLTSSGVLVRRQVAERAVRAVLTVIDAPRFDLGPRIVDGGELMHVQALIAEAAVKRFDERVIYGFAGPSEIELDATLIRPIFQSPRGEFGAMVQRQ